MKHRIVIDVFLLTAAVTLLSTLTARADEAKGRPEKSAATNKVYGEWLIRPRPDKGAEYTRLIEQRGLPLFRAAGGRMVGWWTTLIGNLYEHVTIWEYDDMAAFQKAVEYLGANDKFKEFVALRDPLLTGEESRFLKPTAFAEKPTLPDAFPFVIHEIHRVPLRQMDAYLKFMDKEGLPLLKKHGFRPVGPWLVGVGKWTEVTYLFRFQSLAERDRLMAEFGKHADAQTYGKVMEYLDEISTRLLLPAPFAQPPPRSPTPRRSSRLLPHVEQVAPGIYAAGFADRYRSANCGWVALKDETLLLDLPRGVPVADFLAEVARFSGKPARKLALTHFQPEDAPIVAACLEQGIGHVLTSSEIGKGLLAASKIPPDRIKSFSKKAQLGDGQVVVDLLPLDGIVAKGAAAISLPGQRVLFAGPFVVNGPRARLPGTDTALWVETLRHLEQLQSAHIVPGFGSWGGAGLLERQRQFLEEMRRQVGYFIAQGRLHAALLSEIRVSDGLLQWMPYDYPIAEDIDHVYGELTVPAAPFNGRVPQKSDRRPHALVLIGDLPHEPGHIEQGLRRVFEATGVTPHFTVDVRALTPENLARVQLLVILRDGLQRPRTGPKSEYKWMTPEQERAIVQFVENGGAFLNLHNAMGLYPDDGPYLKLVGGRYIGHGPLERFRVEVVDGCHPITRSVQEFTVADEQHTPPYDAGKVHLLLQSRSDEGKTAAAGWCCEPGKGRLVHLAPGHTREALLHPMYHRLMRNAVDWCLRREATEGPQKGD
jgi:type 1 glutamine amidotransferase